MKRLLLAIAGVFGLRALLRRRHRHEVAAEPPVDELRQKLADSKAAEPEPGPGVEERRADVHERARQAIDDLKNG
jgi:hypothetical protein